MNPLREWMEQINEILHREWAPIAGDPPSDEYEAYVGKIAALLQQNASDDEMLAYLEWAEVTNIGLGGPFDRERAKKVIGTLRLLPIPTISK